MAEDEQQKAKKGLGFYLLIALFLLLAYLLSPGPVIWCVNTFSDGHPGDSIERAFQTIYAPIIYAANNVGWIQDFYNWYAQLWVG